jgi:circadian clock protein KaiC
MTKVGISSLMDSWLLLRTVESNNERNRILYILKSRGTAHSNQMREFILSDKGIDLVDVYTGPGLVLTGAARLQQEARDRESEQERSMEFERRERALSEERTSIEAQMRALKMKLDALKDEGSYVSRKESERRNRGKRDREEASDIRQADKKAVR